MPKTRSIKKIWSSTPTIEGAGVHLNRVFGFHHVPLLDPFLLLDDFHSDNPADYIAGFPWHPHRGIETITYVLQGDVEHGDSMGNRGVISSGDVQWMTAGSGIIHQEMPQGDAEKRLWGFQLWANLPAAQKMMPPRYRGVEAAEIPRVTTDSGCTLRIICGRVDSTVGPVRDIVTDPEYLDIAVPPRTRFSRPVPGGHTVFAYVIEGGASFDPASGGDVTPGHIVLYGHAGDEIIITTAASPVRFLLVSGRPIGEPVAWYGPIVMNTEEELRIAFDEYRDGTFIK